ncbi:Nmad2 family putative nucleotide modification protein [Variovorax boronicumulans]|uniref:Nmad2 family putative nucleotide modification protein n=1 Tax=Variovorax boronicumulans TaxID=436515 RepID=UPI0027D7C8E4|nr:hypothetical protein [Variovorax boronicumulans]
MAIRGYKLTHDSGFAPNPFHGVLTLATCMVKIRSTRQPGDWVAGFASANLVGLARANGVEIPYMGLIYLARVSEVMALRSYFDDPRFALKKNKIDSPHEIERAGDNIYHHDAAGAYAQVRNLHHKSGDLAHDVSGINALICADFWYLGRKCFVPESGWGSVLGDQRIDKARLSALPEDFVQSILLLFRARGIKPGINADPCLWTTPPGIAGHCRPTRKAAPAAQNDSCSSK